MITHGFANELVIDGVTRRIDIAKTDDGNFRVIITTDWPGEAAVITRLGLSVPALNMLISVLLEAEINMDSYPVESMRPAACS